MHTAHFPGLLVSCYLWDERFIFGSMALPDRRNCHQIRHSERRVGVLDINDGVLHINGKVLA